MRKRKTEERIKAIEMHKQGIPRRRIAEELGVSHDSVKTWISLYKSGQKDFWMIQGKKEPTARL